MPQGRPDHVRRQDPSTPYKRVSTASTNAVSIQASPGVVTGYYLSNRETSPQCVKLYDKASAPTVGTDTPVATWDIPARSAANQTLDPPLAFNVGIALAMTATPTDAASDAVTANTMVANIYYQ